jgi:ferredoxin/flavodoxin---NADP+ reductase
MPLYEPSTGIVVSSEETHIMKHWNELRHHYTEVTSNTRIAEGAMLLRFPKIFNFAAGQVIALGIDPSIAPRLYSIASGENDPEIEILFTEKNEGELTPILSSLKPGDRIMVSEPFGTFINAPDNAVYIAAGTGIAPFISRIRSGKGLSPTLVHGASFSEFFYYADELKHLLGRNYIQCCSRCPGDEVFQGRVTRFVAQWDYLDLAKKYYLCGSAEMVVETRDALIARGIPFGNIDAEIFF